MFLLVKIQKEMAFLEPGHTCGRTFARIDRILKNRVVLDLAHQA